MRIVAADDEKLMLDNLVESIKEAEPNAEIVHFSRGKDVLDFAKENQVDVFFLDIKMSGMDGVELAKQVKLLQPRTNIIFATGFSEYMPDAFLLNVSGYLLKPITSEQVREQLDILRFPVSATQSSMLKVQCFGDFEAYINGMPIKFSHTKTKELLAYIISKRGARCTVDEIMVALWEDDSHSSYLRDLKKDLMDTFKKHNIYDVLVVERGVIGINKNLVDCDYYHWIEGTAAGINAYRGEFMYQYSWAEFTNASIQKEEEKRIR